MKKLFTLLLVLSVLEVSAQSDTVVYKHSHKWVQIGLATVSVVTGALGDGLNSRMKYGAGHALCAISYGSIIAIPFFTRPNWKFPVTYLLVRYALFDALYNVGANRNLNYIGGKNYYDESIGRMPLGVLNGTKVLSLGMVIWLNAKKSRS